MRNLIPSCLLLAAAYLGFVLAVIRDVIREARRSPTADCREYMATEYPLPTEAARWN